MESKLVAFAVILLIAGVFHIATTSIAIQCGNENPGYKEAHPSNSNFLISQIVCGILVVILASIGIYLGATGIDASAEKMTKGLDFLKTPPK
jgi:hypothetical protein